jgi:hypothetical protein
MTLGGWLRSLGLERYEAVFSENEIDLDVLPELTEADLKKSCFFCPPPSENGVPRRSNA